jgi:hypothetical protein
MFILLLLSFLITINGYSIGMSGQNIGYSQPNNGLYMNYDIMGGSYKSPYSLGVGLDMNIFDSEIYYNSSNYKNYSSYIMGVVGKIGYSFKDNYGIPINIKTGIGYGSYITVINKNFGPLYETSIDMELYKNIGIGIKYNILNTSNFKSENSIIYINFGQY